MNYYTDYYTPKLCRYGVGSEREACLTRGQLKGNDEQ